MAGPELREFGGQTLELGLSHAERLGSKRNGDKVRLIDGGWGDVPAQDVFANAR